ncbi:Sec-independent protein translocase subunit TatA [Streptomyces syringium]|uniref:Sec-independent protein translocase subunit TatA n=1 Tax=Streptomyces syringium TaxID=76729 RepID=UPI003D9390B8
MLRNALEPWHILVVVLAVVVLFGSKKLPDTARALGKSMRILKSEARAMRSDGTDATGTETAGTGASGEPAAAPGSPADSRR